MIVCPNCRHTNMAGAMFCIECGAHLTGSDSITTQNIAPDDSTAELVNDMPIGSPYRPLATKLDTWATLHLMETGQMLPLSERDKFTLGRISDGQPIVPDIDLSPYHAYANGVSRLHAVIRRDASQAFIMDLGSSNGTYLNGKRLTPNVEQALQHADVISLGKLKIQVLLKNG